MDPLRAFIRGAFVVEDADGGRLLAVARSVADAVGGDVRKSEKGWGVGRHVYDVLETPDWMSSAGRTVALSVSRRSQVITPPAAAITLARSAHADHAMLAYQDAPVMSLQGHPEFSDDFVAALYSARRGKSLTERQVDDAIASLASPVDRERVGQWMANFLRTAR